MTLNLRSLSLRLSNDGTEFGGSIYQKVNDELETAVTLAWTAGSNNTRFGIAAKYKLDKDASLSVSAPAVELQKLLFGQILKTFFLLFGLIMNPQAKVNNASLIGVGYTQSLRPGELSAPTSVILIQSNILLPKSIFHNWLLMETNNWHRSFILFEGC